MVRLSGPDLAILREQAAVIEEILRGIDGVVNEHVDLSTDVPQLQVQVDLEVAARYGLKPGDVRRAAATMIAGEEVGDIFRDGRAYDVMVWSVPSARDSVPDVQDLLIDTPSGQQVRLADVASVTVQPSPNAIEREDGTRHLDILADVDGSDIATVGEALDDRLDQQVFPRGYHVELLGEFQEQQDAAERMLGVGLVAVALIFLLLHMALGHWRPALISFVTLPIALVGGVLAAFAGGGVISIGSLVGFFTIFGIAARNGILLISHAQHLERAEGMPFGPELVIRAARERLAPILMTSLATGLALVPLVLLGERPGQEIEYPLAVVILGGLLTSTVLSLFVLPALYLRHGRPGTAGRPAVGGPVRAVPPMSPP